MADLATLQERLDTLRAIRAEGTRRSRLADGREVEYRTDDELAAAIVDLERQIRGPAAAPKVVYFNTSKGL